MAKFLKSQSLDLLGRFGELGLDDDTLDSLSERCELLHETAEDLYLALSRALNAAPGETQD